MSLTDLLTIAIVVGFAACYVAGFVLLYNKISAVECKVEIDFANIIGRVDTTMRIVREINAVTSTYAKNVKGLAHPGSSTVTVPSAFDVSKRRFDGVEIPPAPPSRSNHENHWWQIKEEIEHI